MSAGRLSVGQGLSRVGLARLLGISRTRAAELAESGSVEVDGRGVGKSDRLVADAWLSVDVSALDAPAALAPEPVVGLTIVHDDADVVVVDKPVGVAAHPSPGWPWVLRRSRAPSRSTC